MQQSSGSIGHAKHRQAFGKFGGNKNRTVSLLVERMINRSLDEQAKLRANRRNRMYPSVRELFDKETN